MWSIDYHGDAERLASHENKEKVERIVINHGNIDREILKLFTSLRIVMVPSYTRFIPRMTYIVHLATKISNDFDVYEVAEAIDRSILLERLDLEVDVSNKYDPRRLNMAITDCKTLKSVSIGPKGADLIYGVTLNDGIKTFRTSLTKESSYYIRYLTNITYLSLNLQPEDVCYCGVVVELARHGTMRKLYLTCATFDFVKLIMGMPLIETLEVFLCSQDVDKEYIMNHINDHNMIFVRIKHIKYLSLKSISSETHPLSLAKIGENYADTRIVVDRI